ncbi:glycoside hydrolase family 68 protein [Niallia sp. 01092]|uniref:glycoside hydrolase family 68 protein n=1 Tax=unclassified Niallia TaxID=2837522 RepID=UPI003FD59A58
MNIQKIFKQATAVTFASALLVGGGSLASAKEKDSMDFKESYGISHIERSDMLKMSIQQKLEKFKVPTFDASTIKNIPSAKGFDNNGNPIDLDVWDTWPLQNADGTVAEYNGYEIVFGLAGDPKNPNDTFIYMFYKKVGDNSIKNWKNAGKVFKATDKLGPNDPILNKQSEEWSGSATLTSDGKVRLFYTNRHEFKPENGDFGKQTLTTAQVNVSQPDSDTLKINGVEDFKSIFDGDGKYYQTVDQAFGGGDFSDNHTLRDPHYVEENGKKYLVFEANTGTEVGYQGAESLYNKAYYGKSEAFFQLEKNKLMQNPKKKDAEIANGALGIIELNDDYTMKKVMKPLLASNTVTDEIERANVFEMNGKWYLFTSTRGSKMIVDGIGSKDIYMLGYVADSLTGEYKPLNGTGLVLHHALDPNDVTFNYAHFVTPNKNKDNNLVVTSYMTNRGYFKDQHSTFAPSFLLNINGSKTEVVKDSILEQGQLTVEENDKK